MQIVSHLILPILDQLQPGCDPEAVLAGIWDSLERFGSLESGTKVTEQPQALFARLDGDTIL